MSWNELRKKTKQARLDPESSSESDLKANREATDPIPIQKPTPQPKTSIQAPKPLKPRSPAKPKASSKPSGAKKKTKKDEPPPLLVKAVKRAWKTIKKSNEGRYKKTRKSSGHSGMRDDIDLIDDFLQEYVFKSMKD